MVGMNIAGKVRSQCLYLSEKETNQQTDLSFQSNILNSLLLSVSNIWCQIANSTLYYFLISFSFLGFYSIHFWSSRRNKNWKVSTTTKKSVKKVTFVQLCLSLALFPLVSTFSSFFFIVPFFLFSLALVTVSYKFWRKNNTSGRNLTLKQRPIIILLCCELHNHLIIIRNN